MNQLSNPINLLTQKIYNLIDQQLKKHIKSTIKLNNVTDIDLQLVKKLKQQYGIGGLIIDVDETLRKDLLKIPDCNKEWLNYMKQEFKVIILSNGMDKDVKTFANENGIEYLGFCHKPMKKYFLKAADKMGLDPENILVIGDDIISDIYGGNKSGMFTAIVEEVISKEEAER